MIYRSNLTCPDLSPHFKLRHPAKQIMGHDAPSDPDYEPECGYFTHDEAAILYNVARLITYLAGAWYDIGSRFGWTAAHISAAGAYVIGIDPIYEVENMYLRAVNNLSHRPRISYCLTPNRKARVGGTGSVIDGNHDSPEPLNDAIWASSNERAHKVILFHDFWGKPIRDGVNYLLDQGYSCRIYDTPNGVALCWRGMPDFIPPDHVPDPALRNTFSNLRRQAAADFDFSRCV